MMTLEYAGGGFSTEKALWDWGFDQDTAEMLQANAGMDVFTLAMPGVSVTVDPIIAFEQQVIIRSGRTGSGTAWSDGTIEFQGKRLLAVLDGRPEYEGVIYQFGGPWYDIDQTPYQQTVYTWTGPGTTTAADLVSDLVLFQKVTGAGTSVARNTGQQVQDILQHVLDEYSAQSMAAPFQIGLISPALNLMTYQVKDIKCSEAIQMCLRSSPDATVSFDYSTSPPTVKVLKQAGMTPASIAIADGIKHESLSLTPRYDLQARSVVLFFKQTNTINGNVYVQKTKQKYPLAGPDGGLRVLVQTIDLAGWTVNTVQGDIVCSAVANTQAWWQKYIPELASGKIASFSVGSMSVVDADTGVAVSLATYPNVLDDGAVASWMQLGGGTPVIAKRVTITAIAAYQQKDSAGRIIEVFQNKELVARVTVTNGVTGSYTTLASATAGESIPSGLAQDVYTALNTLQHEGTITLVQEEISGAPTVANVLNLTGGLAEWTTMNALIQTVRRRWGPGKTEIAIGPARHLSPQDLTQLFLINRFRRVWVNPASQATGQLSTSGTVALGANAPKENTHAGLEERSVLALANPIPSTTNAKIVRMDGGGQSLAIAQYDATYGQLASTSSIVLAAAHIEPDSIPRNAQFRLLTWRDPTTCDYWKAYVMMTAPEPA